MRGGGQHHAGEVYVNSIDFKIWHSAFSEISPGIDLSPVFSTVLVSLNIVPSSFPFSVELGKS